MKKIAKVFVLLFAVWLVGCGGGGGNSNNNPPQVINYQFWGINFSQNLFTDPNLGQEPTAEETISLYQQVKPYFKVIRLFTSTDIIPGQTRMRSGHSYISYTQAEQIMKSTRAPDVQFIVTAWLSSDLVNNEEQINALIELSKNVPIYIGTAGGEVLLRNELSESQIIGYLNRLKAAGINSSVNDTWYELTQHPNVANACDVIVANIYPYWEGVGINVSVKYLREKYLLLQNMFGKEVIIGETGWPSGGNTIGSAVPNPANAAFYFLNVASWAQAENIKVVWFEAYDENWKVAYEGPQGAHWGIWDTSRKMKPNFQLIFDGQIMTDNWSK